MNVHSWLVWGTLATIVLTTLMVAGQRLNLSRVNLPFLLGTMVSVNRQRARIYGVFLHMANGLFVSLLYVQVFHALGKATWWIGAILGLVQAAFVLVVLLPVFPTLHPRMADEQTGPTVVKRLEPPGFLGLNYGVQTPLAIVAAHLPFGIILGAFYQL